MDFPLDQSEVMSLTIEAEDAVTTIGQSRMQIDDQFIRIKAWLDEQGISHIDRSHKYGHEVYAFFPGHVYRFSFPYGYLK